MRPFAWLSLFLVAIYFVYGAYIPFWSLWLASRDLSADQIGLLIGVGLAIRFAGQLLIMGKANRASLLIPTCRYLALASAACFVGFYGVSSFWSILALMLVANFIYPTLLPLSEALAARMMLQVKLDYGRVRLWGSAAFILGSMVVGALVKHSGPDWVLHTMIIGLLALILCSWLPMVPAPQDASASGHKVGFWPLLRNKPFLLFLLVVSLLQGSHAAYYGFSALYWEQHGYATNVIGYLWASGVVAEIVMFAVSKRLFRGLSYQQMFLIGAVGCVIRWSILASTTELPWLVVAQLLHAVTFCVSHLAAVRYMTQQMPSDQLIPAQTLYAALPTGMFTAVLTILSGVVYQHAGGMVFWGMAALVLPVFFLRVPTSRLQSN